MKLDKNIGARDAQFRTIAAVVVLVGAFFFDNPWVRIVLALVAAVLAATGYFHFCYLYKLLGKNTTGQAMDKKEEPAPVAEPVHETPTPVEETAVDASTDSEKVA